MLEGGEGAGSLGVAMQCAVVRRLQVGVVRSSEVVVVYDQYTRALGAGSLRVAMRCAVVRRLCDRARIGFGQTVGADRCMWIRTYSYVL